MAGRSEEDDYWNASLTQQRAKAFNFEEEEIFGSQLCGVSKSGTAKLSKEAREGMDSDSTLFNIDSLTGSLSAASIAEFPQTSERPLQSLISEKALQCILEARFPQEKRPKNLSPEEEVRILRRKIEDRWVAPPVTTTVNKIMLGHPYSLELYHSLKSKTELLDAAIALGDGNAILAVILFLTQTLKKSLVYQLLRDRPVAVSQYCSYLSTRYQLQELTDLLEMLGESREAAMKQFQLGVSGTINLQRRLQKLKACLSNHFGSPDSKDRVFIENYIKLLEWQFTVAGSNAEIAKDLFGLSVLESLAYTCRHYWEEPRGSIYSPVMLSQQQGINERQFQWTVLTVRASMKAWDDIENLFITKSWLGGKKLKAAVPMDQVVMQLHSCGAESTILNKYLELIDNVDKRIALASKLQCHTVVVDVLVAKRDRRALENYKANLHPQSSEYFYAENALHVSTTKWKN